MSSSHPQPAFQDRYYFKRCDTRFKVSAACRFWWPSATAQPAFGSGQTIDVGIRGVSVSTSVLPPLGSAIMLEVDLPRVELDIPEMTLVEADLQMLTHDSFLLLTAEGTVLRHHRKGNGFVAVMTQTSFARQEQGREA